MKRIQTILVALVMLLGASALFTSCQEDAPEINYTMNVTVTNDFTKVVEAINSGNVNQDSAIKKLTEAIEKMNSDQATKLQAIIDVLNNVNNTLETKLAAIEAAMRAQTFDLNAKLELLIKAINSQTLKQEELAGYLKTAIESLTGDLNAKLKAIADVLNNVNNTLETKLAAIEAAMKAHTFDFNAKMKVLTDAINALPDYTSQLDAIKTAIANLPDYADQLDAIKTAITELPNYSDKFDAVVEALGLIKEQVEALGTAQSGIATQIANTTTAINNLITAVNNGNTDAANALADIIKKLEELKTAIGNINTGGGGTAPTREYVDLGLPSGLKWATYNIGATKPEEFGDYYAWGMITPITTDYNGISDYPSELFTKYNSTSLLLPEDDAATVAWGSPWRIPTWEECLELLDNCTIEYKVFNGVMGHEVKSKVNGNTIFLPAAGNFLNTPVKEVGEKSYYQSRSAYPYAARDAWRLMFKKDGTDLINPLGHGMGGRQWAGSVRAVRP